MNDEVRFRGKASNLVEPGCRRRTHGSFDQGAGYRFRLTILYPVRHVAGGWPSSVRDNTPCRSNASKVPAMESGTVHSVSDTMCAAMSTHAWTARSQIQADDVLRRRSRSSELLNRRRRPGPHPFDAMAQRLQLRGDDVPIHAGSACALCPGSCAPAASGRHSGTTSSPAGGRDTRGVALDDALSLGQRLREKQWTGAVQIDKIDVSRPAATRDFVVQRKPAVEGRSALAPSTATSMSHCRCLSALRERPEDAVRTRYPVARRRTSRTELQYSRVFHRCVSPQEDEKNNPSPFGAGVRDDGARPERHRQLSMERPIPTTLPETEAFWQGCRDGLLLLRSCRACGHLQYYPRVRLHGLSVVRSRLGGR